MYWCKFLFSVLQNIFSYSASRTPLGCLREHELWLGIRCVCVHANPVTCFFTYTTINWNALKNANHKTSLETLSIWHILKPISVFDSVLQQKAGAALFLLTAKRQPSKSAQPAILAGSLWSRGAPGSRAQTWAACAVIVTSINQTRLGLWNLDAVPQRFWGWGGGSDVWLVPQEGIPGICE